MVQVFINVKTTGLDYATASIWEVSGIITNGRKEDYFNYKMSPYKPSVESKALAMSGITERDLRYFPDQSYAFNSFVDLLDSYIEVSDYQGKAQLIGYNSNFEAGFLREWFKHNNYNKFGYYFWFPYIDVMTFAGIALMDKREQLPNFKLSTVYYFATGKILQNRTGRTEVACLRELYNSLVDLGAQKLPESLIPVRKVKTS